MDGSIFFGFQDDKLSESDDTLFVCIVRNPVDWINSFYREKHHLPLKYKKMNEKAKLNEFLMNEIWSFNDNKNNRDISKEIMEDRNIYTHERYKNIFELRHVKLKWMIEDLPKKVKHYIFIRYEDLIDDLEGTLMKIESKGLMRNPDIDFPVNVTYYKKEKKSLISEEQILSNPNMIEDYEQKVYNIKKINPK